MDAVLLLAFQFVVPVTVGALVTLYLRSVMGDLLVDLCGTVGRAEFWVRVSAVLIMTVPLMMVLAGTTSPFACTAGSAACAVATLRETCVLTLIGMLLAVGGIAGVMALQIPERAKTDAANGAAPAATTGAAA